MAKWWHLFVLRADTKADNEVLIGKDVSRLKFGLLLSTAPSCDIHALGDKTGIH
jgi:hypothetical protein